MNQLAWMNSTAEPLDWEDLHPTEISIDLAYSNGTNRFPSQAYSLKLTRQIHKPSINSKQATKVELIM